ncbi:MAG: heavy metal-associated domain-containing protein [Betaproteobacteria bacterium]
MSATVTQEFAVEGMNCQGCVKSVTGAVRTLPGVEKIDVSLEKKTATVAYDGAALQPAAIVAAIVAAGFEAQAR